MMITMKQTRVSFALGDNILELFLFLNNQESSSVEKSANSLEKKAREGEKIWNWPLDWNVGFKVWI